MYKILVELKLTGSFARDEFYRGQESWKKLELLVGRKL